MKSYIYKTEYVFLFLMNSRVAAPQSMEAHVHTYDHLTFWCVNTRAMITVKRVRYCFDYHLIETQRWPVTCCHFKIKHISK